jgi:hypothetical protein
MFDHTNFPMVLTFGWWYSSQTNMLDIDQLLMGRITDMEKAIVFMNTMQKKPKRKRKRESKSVDKNRDTSPIETDKLKKVPCNT